MSAAVSPTPAKIGPAAASERRDSLAFIIDEEGSIRQFVSLILQGSGIDTIEFIDGASFRGTVAARPPDLVFINVNLDHEAAEIFGVADALVHGVPDVRHVPP